MEKIELIDNKFDYKAAERQKAHEIAVRLMSEGLREMEGINQRKAIEEAILEAIEWKNAEFEVLINSLPEPILELIKIYANESK